MRMLTLEELESACHLYGDRANFDTSYHEFLRSTDRWPDLARREHRDALLRWLRKWSLWQFAVDCHDLASEEILTWHNEQMDNLVPFTRQIWDLKEPDLRCIRDVYQSLSGRIACYRHRNGHRFPVRVGPAGPAGTANILFALRPHAFLPWNAAIRDELGYGPDAQSYVSYLGQLKVLLRRDVAPICRHHNLSLTDLPQRLNRPLSSVPKIIDEYLWVTLSAGRQDPNPCVVQRLTNPSPR